jgi:transposase-like protein
MGAAMAITEISDAELDAYLSMPDCPQCGSDDVVCTDSYPDGFGNIVKVYYCNKCGHSWAEVE